MKLNQRQVQHLLLRMGFGDSYSRIQKYVKKNPEKILDTEWALADSKENIDYEKEDAEKIAEWKEANPGQMKDMDKSMRKDIRKQGREIVLSLNRKWIERMTMSESGGLDKMALFWHDHFACASQNPVHIHSYINTIRSQALGNFGDMLKAVSKEPAMLQYLNNQQNRKKAPNENFAREVMELFTLGRDQGYTETDIKEAARAFTGWGFNRTGKYMFREKQHDFGEKTFLGKTGNLTGEEVLEQILKLKRTAEYISEKWVRFFVHQDGDKTLEKEVADALYDSNYDIKTGLKALFSNERFYDTKNIGSRVKSPIEFIISNFRMTETQVTDQQSLIYLQQILGQKLFAPPNVAGWPDGYDWVDSSTLMFRVSLPGFLFKSGELQEHPGKSFDDNDPFFVKKRLKKLKAIVDFEKLEKELGKLSDEELRDFLIQVNGVKIGDELKKMELIDKIVDLTSRPEYQLC